MTTFYYYPIDNNLSPFLNKIDHESLPGSFTWLIFIEQELKRLTICFLFILMMIYYYTTYFIMGVIYTNQLKILNFELISSILQISLSNNFLVYSNPMIFSNKICLDLVFNNIRKFYSFLHDQARESIPYRTGQYDRYIPYRSLKQYKNTCVSF